MKRKVLTGLFLWTMAAACVLAQPRVTSLTCNYKVRPLGIDQLQPSLGWKMLSSTENTMQDSYEIRAALSLKDLEKGRNLLWESGKVASSQSVHVKYKGSPLRSFQRIHWQVRITDNHGKRSTWSEPAWFETAFLPDSQWKASWITPSWKEDKDRSMPSPYLRTDFSAKDELVSARLYISAHGLYLAEINGQRVGDQQFTPGWTSYDTRLQYQSYDVLDLIRPGGNALGVMLGDGWYRGYLGWQDNRNQWGNRLSLIAQVRLVYEDGSVEWVLSDGNWKASTGAIRASDIYNGEVFDATMQPEGWSQAGFDASRWTSVEVVEESTSKLIAPEGPPVRIVEELKPLRIEKREQGWLVDMGQNMVGWVQLKATGSAGDTVVLRHAEVLDKEGQMYYDNLRAADATNTFVLKGEGEEVLAPHFTFQGFRYVMIMGYPGELSEDHLRGQVIHSDMASTGSFECSSPLINQLQHNIRWGLKGNFLDVPTDCPQRDERLGWTGDAQVFAPTACFNMEAAGFYKKWLKDLATDQTEEGMIHHVIPNLLDGGGATGWADAGVIIPWVVYLSYGDKQVLVDQYESMKAWIAYMEKHAGEDRIWQEDDWHWGDWLSYDASQSDYMGAYTTKDLIATAYFSYSSALVSKVASILGREEDAAYYKNLSDEVKRAFRQEYVTPNGRLVSHTQTAYTLALAFDLLEPQRAGMAATHLQQDVRKFGHITTGFLGTPLISHVLSEQGMDEEAYMLLMREEYPSWLYPVTMGATTIWERWDGQKPDSTFQTPGMNSFNHYAYGAIGDWLYKHVAGIQIDENQPGYKHFYVAPHPGGGLRSARASLESMYGTMVSGWNLEEGNLNMEVEIPPNASATLQVPGEAASIFLNGEALESGERSYQCMDGYVAIPLGSGSYQVITKL